MKRKGAFWNRLIIALSIIVPLAVATLFMLPADMKIQWGEADLKSMPFFHADRKSVV